MSLKRLLVEIVTVAFWVRTEPLLSLFAGQMRLQVGAVVVASLEPLPALFALEGLLTSMDLLVPFEVRYLCEGFAAAWVSALVGLLSCVDSQVLLEGRVLSERLPTSIKGTLLNSFA